MTTSWLESYDKPRWCVEKQRYHSTDKGPYNQDYDLFNGHVQLLDLDSREGKMPKYWSFSFNISPSSEYSGLIFFRIDWFDLFPLQGTLKSLLQHHS